MNGELNKSQIMTEKTLTRALEKAPDVGIPAEFAARVRSALPASQPARVKPPLVRVVAFAAAGLLMLALFLLAPHTQPSAGSISFYVELLLIVELGAVAYWLARPQHFMD